MPDPLSTLADLMSRSRTVGFIGAGYAVRSGYPTWGELLGALYRRTREYSDDVPSPGEGVDNRWLAEVYAEELARHGSLQVAIRESFEAGQSRRAADGQLAAGLDRMQILVARLPFKHFITTNYDGLLERACDTVFEQREGRKPKGKETCIPRDGRINAQFSDFLGSMTSSRRSVLHLHGRLQGDELTLSMGEYDQQYLHDAMLLRMFSIFATSTVVFIGSSLDDVDMMELLRRSAFHTNRQQRHYAFLPKTRERYADMLQRTFGVEPIFYGVVDDDHSELDRRLERLLEMVERRRRRDIERAAHTVRPLGPGAGSAIEAVGNVRPVRAEHGAKFDEAVEHAKDAIRRVTKGPAPFSFPLKDGIRTGGVAGSRVLRRIATDYQELASTYWFRHVVWISPGRIGLFPGDRSRKVLDAVIGEVMHSLGRHRATSTVDRQQNLRAIAQILGDTRWGPGSEPALLVIDGFNDLLTEADRDGDGLRSLLYALPNASVAVYEQSPENQDEGDVNPAHDEPERSGSGGAASGGADSDGAGSGSDVHVDDDAEAATLAQVLDGDAEAAADEPSVLDEETDLLAWRDDSWNDRLADLFDRAHGGSLPPDEEDDGGAESDGDDAQRADEEAREACQRWCQAADELRTLVALCIVATPIRSDQLTTILELDKHEIDRTLRALGELDLIEGVSSTSVSPPIRTTDHDLAEPVSMPIGILNPIRAATLERAKGSEILIEVVSTILHWAESTTRRLHQWENDRAQLNELSVHLPNMLAAFEAGCWVCDEIAPAPGSNSDCHLWLGADLAYILYSLGRWAEAGQLLAYLSDHAERVSERPVFRREVLILQAGFFGHAGRPESDFDMALELVDRAIADASRAVASEAKATKSRARAATTTPQLPTYAPVELTAEGQLHRATIRKAEVLVHKVAHVPDAEVGRVLDKGKTRSPYRRVEQALGEICRAASDLEDLRRVDDDRARVIADASQALAAFRLLQKRAGGGREMALDAVLAELDRGRAASERVRCRPRGYNARLRGEVLLAYSDADENHVAAARRCFARALLISYEFKDRYLEAASRLGLARCDERRSLAVKAAEIFDDLKRSDEWGRAAHYAIEPSFDDEPGGRPRRYPTLVVIVGIPGSGKSAAIATASSVLGEWGFDPVRPRFTPRLIERIRSNDELNLEMVGEQLEDQGLARRDEHVETERVVVLKVPTGRLRDLFVMWSKQAIQMRDVLCIHLTTSVDGDLKTVLGARNKQRRGGRLDQDKLDEMIAQEIEQTKSTFSTWETWFQCRQGSYVSIDFNAPITEFEARVRDALALSYMSVEKLVEFTGDRFE